jgi:hypothetical protein
MSAHRVLLIVVRIEIVGSLKMTSSVVSQLVRGQAMNVLPMMAVDVLSQLQLSAQ